MDDAVAGATQGQTVVEHEPKVRIGGEVVDVVSMQPYSDHAAPLASMAVAIQDGQAPAPVGRAAPVVVVVVTPDPAAACTRAVLRPTPASWIVDPAGGAHAAIPALPTAAAMPEQIAARPVVAIPSWQERTTSATAGDYRPRTVATLLAPESCAPAVTEPPLSSSRVQLERRPALLARHVPTLASFAAQVAA